LRRLLSAFKLLNVAGQKTNDPTEDGKHSPDRYRPRSPLCSASSGQKAERNRRLSFCAHLLVGFHVAIGFDDWLKQERAIDNRFKFSIRIPAWMYCNPRSNRFRLPKLNQIFLSQSVIDGNSSERPTRDCYGDL
jgi:hypothetical protein